MPAVAQRLAPSRAAAAAAEAPGEVALDQAEAVAAAREARGCQRRRGRPVASPALPALPATLRRPVVVVVLASLARADAHPRPAQVREPQRRLQDRTDQRLAGREELWQVAATGTNLQKPRDGVLVGNKVAPSGC